MNRSIDDLIGKTLCGRFEIVEHIASGGMGSVYKAIQHPLERIVALKVMDDGDDLEEEFQRRFFLEASLCARLSHPNIVRIFDYGCHEDSIFFIAMEYLEGETLKQYIKRSGPLHPDLAITFISQIASALVEAHEANLVHRDLKPSNLFVTTDKMGNEHVKILDFGVVKHTSAKESVTQVGLIVGSPWYMSPEQIENAEIDGRSDLYSIGIVLYQLITGNLPFTAKSAIKVIFKHLQDQPPPMVECAPGVVISNDLKSLVKKLLQKSPKSRYRNARELILALNGLGSTEKLVTPGVRSISKVDISSTDLGDDSYMMTQMVPSSEADKLPLEIDREEFTPFSTGSILQLQDIPDYSFIAYIDFNCPYCFALHERIQRWNLGDKIKWEMIEHSSHILDGPFDIHQEQLLTTEVVEVHHRAPDVDLLLPAQRCRSTTATRLQTYVQREFMDKRHEFRTAVFRSLWQNGEDIGDHKILMNLLDANNIPGIFLDFCSDEPPEIQRSQKNWQEGPYDTSIPVLLEEASGRVLIGLPDERTLKEFLLGVGSRVLDSAACYYQQRPTILLNGWVSHIWPILSDVRNSCELIQAPTFERAVELLSEIAVPDLIIVETNQHSPETIQELSKLASSRSVPWVVATQTPSSDEEIKFLSMGAVEYLPTTGDLKVARARLQRVLKDRYNLEHEAASPRTDTLTQLSTRHKFLENLRIEWEGALKSEEPVSLILIDIDGFKGYNRAHGYLAGNKALTTISKGLNGQVRGAGTEVARFSGNEFAVLLPGYREADAAKTASRLQNTVTDLNIENRGSGDGSVLTVTVGSATVLPSEETSLYTLVDHAAAKVKSAKASRT